MERKIDLHRTADELTTYAAQRQAGFEQDRLGDSYRQPETRHEWIRDILCGMAEVNGADSNELTARFDQQLEAAHGCSAVEMLPLIGQKHIVRALGQYASALGQLDGDQRGRLMQVQNLLEDMTAYLPWDPDANGARSVRDQVWEQLQRAVAQRPIRFTRVLLGGDLDPGGVELMPGLVDDAEGVKCTREFQRLTVEYPKRDQWPALCTVYLGGGRQNACAPIDADGLDMKIIREAEDQFLKQPSIRPVCTSQLQVPVYEQIRVLKVEPGKAPEKVAMPNTLEALQAAVGGYIEVLGLDSDAVLICNEEGKLMGLSANRRVGGDMIAGTFLIAGETDGEFCSLSDDAAAYYGAQFKHPMPTYGNTDEPTQWEFHVL